MESELIGALGAVSVGLLGVVAVLLRRGNGKSNHNPNFETLEVLSQQQLDVTKELRGKLDQVLLMLTETKGVVANCEAVQQAIRQNRGG